MEENLLSIFVIFVLKCNNIYNLKWCISSILEMNGLTYSLAVSRYYFEICTNNHFI